MKMADFCNSDLLVNYHDISGELRRLYVLTRNCHPDESCREVGLPWKEDGVQPVLNQFTVGLLVDTLRTIRNVLRERSNHQWEDFVTRLKSASVCRAKIRAHGSEQDFALSEFCLHL